MREEGGRFEECQEFVLIGGDGGTGQGAGGIAHLFGVFGVLQGVVDIVSHGASQKMPGQVTSGLWR